MSYAHRKNLCTEQTTNLDKTAPAAAASAPETPAEMPAEIPAARTIVSEPAIPADVTPDLTVVPHVMDVSDHVKSYFNKVLDHPGRAIRAICDSRDSDRAMRLRLETFAVGHLCRQGRQN